MTRRIYWGIATLIILLVGVSVVILTRTTDTELEVVVNDVSEETLDNIRKENNRQIQSTQKQPTEPKQLSEGHSHSTAESEGHSHPKSTHGTEPIKYKPAPGKFISGPYAGMTVEEAQLRIQRKRELDRKWKANLDKFSIHTKAALQRADDQSSMILSVFKLLSPEQLEHARVAALKVLPAEEVESFFDDLTNEGISKTLEEIASDAQHILATREVHAIVGRELDIEYEEIVQEYKDFYGADVYERRQREAAERIERKLALENPELLEAIRHAKR